MSRHIALYLTALLSTLGAVLLVTSTNAAAAEVTDCVNTSTVCTTETQQDVAARNYCTAKANEIIDAQYKPANGAADKEGVRIGIVNSCFTGYRNGQDRIEPEKAAEVCNGSVLNQAKEQIQADFPQICRDAYKQASGQSLDGIKSEKSNQKSCDDKSNQRFLTAPAWYRGILDGDCKPSVTAKDGNWTKFIAAIILNIAEIILNVVGYACVTFIIVGGYRIMTSGGSADGVVAGRKTIINAIIGLIISMSSIAIVNLIASGL